MERAVEARRPDRRRGRRRAHQSRLRRRAARAHDGGPARRGRPAPRRLRGGRRRVPQRGAGAGARPAPARRPVRRAVAPGAGPHDGHADDARGRREPERHAARRRRRSSTSAARPTGPTTRWPTCCVSRSTSNVVVTSQRLVPCETPAGSRLLATARRVRPEATTFGSPTCSDWVFLRHTDAIKCGPGTSRRSHTAGRVRRSARGHRRAGVLRRAGAGVSRRRRGRVTQGLRPSGPRRGRSDGSMLAYTAGDDRPWDARLLRWDVLGSLGHIEGLRAVAPAGAPRACPPPRGSPRGAGRGGRRPAPGVAAARGRAHRGRGLAHPPPARASASGCTPAAPATTRSPCDLRLYLKDRLLALHAGALDAGRGAARASPRATAPCSGPDTPISAGRCRRRWDSGPGRTPRACSIRSEALAAASGRGWTARPLGSAAGYGVPLPLKREAAARALGFAGLDRNVATVQGGPRQARGGGAVLVHPAGARAGQAVART